MAHSKGTIQEYLSVVEGSKRDQIKKGIGDDRVEINVYDVTNTKLNRNTIIRHLEKGDNNMKFCYVYPIAHTILHSL